MSRTSPSAAHAGLIGIVVEQQGCSQLAPKAMPEFVSWSSQHAKNFSPAEWVAVDSPLPWALALWQEPAPCQPLASAPADTPPQPAAARGAPGFEGDWPPSVLLSLCGLRRKSPWSRPKQKPRQLPQAGSWDLRVQPKGVVGGSLLQQGASRRWLDLRVPPKFRPKELWRVTL